MPTVRYTTVNGRILSENRSGVKRDYVADPLGSTVALLDNTQTKTDTFSYWPYGEETHLTGTTPTPFQFVGTAGYYRDSASKSYVRARVLDKVKGRWLTQDPIGLYGGDVNPYSYVANQPIILRDVTGMQPVIDPIWQRDYEQCLRHKGASCFNCAFFIISYHEKNSNYRSPYVNCLITNGVCHSRINCDNYSKVPWHPAPVNPSPPPGQKCPPSDPCASFGPPLPNSCMRACQNIHSNQPAEWWCQDCCDEIAAWVPQWEGKDLWVAGCYNVCVQGHAPHLPPGVAYPPIPIHPGGNL